MDGAGRVAAKVEHARRVEGVLQWLGWVVAVVGLAGIAVFSALWAVGGLTEEQGVSLILGTALATVLSGATAYGSGVNVGLGAERLELAARSAASGAVEGPGRAELGGGARPGPVGGAESRLGEGLGTDLGYGPLAVRVHDSDTDLAGYPRDGTARGQRIPLATR